jgi:sugar/nucleoside kinase (ribokinase family)
MKPAINATSSVCRRSQASDATVVTVGSCLPDVHVLLHGPTSGNKHGARFVDDLGGVASNLGRVAAANGIPTAVLTTQRAGWASHYVRQKAAGYGLRLLLQEREDEGPALSVIVPNGCPGRKDIYTQRMGPPTVAGLTPEMEEALAMARLVIVGPLAHRPETRDLLCHLPALAPTAFKALLPHPSLIQDSMFALITQRYDYVQLNAAESRLLDGATNDVATNARRLSFLVGEQTASAVTNGADPGFLFAEGHWYEIRPKPVKPVDDTACGDVFAASFLVGWRLLGLGVVGALLYGIEAAAKTALQVGLGEPLSYERASVAAGSV